MIKISFNEPQEVWQDRLMAISKFVHCFKYVKLISGDIIVTDNNIQCCIYEDNVKSIERVKPTDL